jgi:Mg2+ and Co2+ transporter CorA
MAVYLSAVSNRINAVLKQLTINATILFVRLGVGSEIVALLALLAFFRRRGWF